MKISTFALSACFLFAACDQKKSETPAAEVHTATVPAAVPAAATPTAAAPAMGTATAAAPAATSDPPMIAVGTKMKCPVSGEEFTVKESTQQVVYAGKRYAFCCSDCKPDFEKNPAKFAAK